MPPDCVPPEDLDDLMGWPAGTAAKLARRRKLPHYRLPDGGLAFSRAEIVGLIEYVPVAAGKAVAGAA